MEKRDLEVGDVVQIDPDHDELFGGALMIVTEPKPWGAMGAITSPEMIPKGVAHYRCEFRNMEFIGRAKWLIG